MPITQDFITATLSGFSIPQGQCGQRAFEIAGLLLNQNIDPFPGTRYRTLSDALAAISNALSHNQIAMLWLDTGPIDPTNPNNRAIHCYFVFQENPLQSFAVWQAPGVCFYNQSTTISKMVEAINLFQNDGGIEMHLVPI